MNLIIGRGPTLANCILWKLVLILLTSLPALHCQFISHINAKGLRGNLTFDIREEANVSLLVIESYIESAHLGGNKLEGELVGSQPIISFDWTLHSNTLSYSMLSTCSNDDLGPTVSASLKNSLSENRPILLNKSNRWSIPLQDFLKANQAPTLSSLIWGKSIRLKLSDIYGEKPSSSPQATNATTDNRINRPLLTPTLTGPSSKPTLAGPSSKPTFAPRPKPSISGKLKTPPALPKPLALVMEDVNLSAKPVAAPAPSTPKEAGVPRTISEITSSDRQESDVAIREANKRILRTFGKLLVCGNIIDTRNVKTAEATFESQIAGKIIIRGNEDDTTLIMHNLYHLKSKITTRHEWRILASDILDSRRHGEQCKYLQQLFDPNNVDDTKCKRSEQTNCKMGDLMGKHGQLQVAGLGKSTKLTQVDLNLPLSALEGSRSLFVVIYEVAGIAKPDGPATTKPVILSCAQILSVNAKKIESTFNMDGVRGSIKMTQRHYTEPTVVSYDLFGLEGNIKHMTIRELPLMSRSSSDNSKLCTTLGEVYNPSKVQEFTPSGDSKFTTTVDLFPVGNLTAKHGQLSVIDSDYEDHYMGEYMDLSIQLYGPHTVAGRSIVIHKNNGDPWICSTLDLDEPVNLAVATFYYPVVGRISFQQASNDPHSETGVLVEVYNPNADRDSVGHNWLVHLKPAMGDFYNWSQRCESSGEIYDPLQASTGSTNDVYGRQCQVSLLSEPLRCRSGDASLKSGFKLSLPVSHLNRTRQYYTDPFMPLSKSNSIIGKSVVIYDEHAPTQRGNRLACSTIKSVHPIRAAIKTWNSGPSIPSAVFGSVLFEQDLASRPTRIKIDLNGFNGNVENYALHNVWMMDDREFPCSNDSLYDIYDPYDNENSLSLPPSAHYGALATVDRVKVGDLSRKHGTFEGLQSVQKSYSDLNVPLFAPRSIIGRSLVLRAAVNDFRWVCGNIELDYDRGESREIVAMASFYEPRSKIAGYIRFVQLEHKDGSLSDTFVQVDLRMQADGVHELQTSLGHNWAVFVNQVGEDAFIAADEVRCIASGFKWNPYLVQDSLETYPNSCTPTEQLACAMGDLGMRHGQLTLGPNNRRTVSDSNLPLVGNYSVMGRSLIIFDNKRQNVKLACANIFPDVHLKSNVVIKKSPSFTVARFVEQMRSLLGAAEWLMVPELRATKLVANGECVQMTIHFYGPKAHQMQSELNNLIALGTVRKSTRVGTDKISTHYKLCRTSEMQLTSSSSRLAVNLFDRFHLLSLMLALLLVRPGDKLHFR